LEIDLFGLTKHEIKLKMDNAIPNDNPVNCFKDFGSFPKYSYLCTYLYLIFFLGSILFLGKKLKAGVCAVDGIEAEEETLLPRSNDGTQSTSCSQDFNLHKKD